MDFRAVLFYTAKFIAVVDGFLLVLQLLPYGGWDGEPGVANIEGWQAIMIVTFVVSVVYLWFKKEEEIDSLKSRLLTYELKEKEK